MNQNDYVTENVFLNKLSNSDLLKKFGNLVQTERKITHLVLEYIAEIDSRKLYLERAYPSLFEFLTQCHGYSPASAMRRIESARLLKEIPELAQKIESGALNLSQISKVSQSIKQAQKNDGVATHAESLRISTEQKKELLSKIEYSTQRQTEQIIAQEFNLPLALEEKQTIHQDGSVTLTIHFSKDEMKILEQASGLIAHAVADHRWAKVITHLAGKEINLRTKIKRPSKQTSNKFEDKKMERTDEFDQIHQRKPLRPNVKKIILQKNQCCQYQDPLTKKICGSTRFLQVDHIQPIFAGGTNDPENLRVLCAQHNQFRYKKENDNRSFKTNSVSN